MSPSKLYHTTGEYVIVDDDDNGERPPMKRSFETMDEIPKYEGPPPKVLVFEGSSLLENRSGICHAVHEVFTTVFPEYRMPSQDEVMDAYSYTGCWPDILAHCGVPNRMYSARRKRSEEVYLQSYVDYDGVDKMTFFSDSVRVLRAAKEEGFVMVLLTVETTLVVDAMLKFGTTDIFDIYLDKENAWISRGADAPPRPIKSNELVAAYDEYLKDKGLKVEGRDTNALKLEDVMVVEGTIKGLESHLEKGEDGAFWGCKLCYVARTEAELKEEMEALLDLEVEDLDEFGYSLFGLVLPATAPARPVAASGPTILSADLTMEDIIEITDGEDNAEEEEVVEEEVVEEEVVEEEVVEEEQGLH